MAKYRFLHQLATTALLGGVSIGMSSCYFVDFFRSSSSGSAPTTAVANDTVLGQSLGAKAGGMNSEALESVYGVTYELAPAPVRPDPDMYARRLLRQYRQEGSTVARQIGDIEGFRLLLGGASDDFQKAPQEDFDATSLLANLTVAEKICIGLVAPDASIHEGWETILPASPEQWQTNITFLAQRFLGVPSSQIDSNTVGQLKTILDASNSDNIYSYTDYVDVCATLALDAEALML